MNGRNRPVGPTTLDPVGTSKVSKNFENYVPDNTTRSGLCRRS
ncbi:hypothetical protein KHHGKMAE_3543 [Methylobacterium persicinum]|nr:hypothetical protein KHHGKMAE_3543 [Methylobacterium persicinum]